MIIVDRSGIIPDFDDSLLDCREDGFGPRVRIIFGDGRIDVDQLRCGAVDLEVGLRQASMIETDFGITAAATH